MAARAKGEELFLLAMRPPPAWSSEDATVAPKLGAREASPTDRRAHRRKHAAGGVLAAVLMAACLAAGLVDARGGSSAGAPAQAGDRPAVVPGAIAAGDDDGAAASARSAADGDAATMAAVSNASAAATNADSERAQLVTEIRKEVEIFLALADIPRLAARATQLRVQNAELVSRYEDKNGPNATTASGASLAGSGLPSPSRAPSRFPTPVPTAAPSPRRSC